MKIVLTVESFLPEVHGMSEVVRQISENLVSKGHEIIVCTSFFEDRDFEEWKGIQIKQFAIRGNMVTGIQGEIDRYQKFILNEPYDVLTNFAAQQWATDLCLELLPQLKAKKVFVPTGFSGLYDKAFATYFEKMSLWMKHYDMNVFLSNDYRDINFARSHGIDKCIVIPNGASFEEFTAKPIFNLREYLGIPEDRKIILHVGSYTTMKGHDEALSIFLTARLENAVLVFVGKNFNSEISLPFITRLNWFKGFSFPGFYRPTAFKQLLRFIKTVLWKGRNSVHLVSLTREELVAAYQQADLFLFPSLIECSPIVLFESMASKTPFLVSEVGNAAEIIQWSGAGKLLPTTIDEQGLSRIRLEESVAILREVVSNKDFLRKMAESGYTKWLARFTWEKIAAQYESLYKQILDAK